MTKEMADAAAAWWANQLRDGSVVAACGYGSPRNQIYPEAADGRS